jgi:transcriptional regulator with XRE-family HTH domain
MDRRSMDTARAMDRRSLVKARAGADNRVMDREQLADFLRHRREALQPQDVGLGNGARRRTTGLRREEVAMLAGMSTDYYARLEQRRGPQPSEQMLDAIARALRLTRAERDHLLRLAGHVPSPRGRRSAHVSPALLRVLDSLETPALVISDLGQTLVQNPAAVALLGDQTGRVGPERSLAYRWFIDPDERRSYPPEDWESLGRTYVARLRTALARDGEDAEVLELVESLQAQSPEFGALWDRHEVDSQLGEEPKRMIHPELGEISLDCQVLVAENQAQALLVYTATPGSDDYEKLQLLTVVGRQNLTT